MMWSFTRVRIYTRNDALELCYLLGFAFILLLHILEEWI